MLLRPLNACNQNRGSDENDLHYYAGLLWAALNRICQVYPAIRRSILIGPTAFHPLAEKID